MSSLVIVNDSFQTNYRYHRTHAPGDFSPDYFSPDYTPNQMLQMGVFEGKYLNDCQDEFQDTDLFHNAKLSDTPDPSLNYFQVKSRKPLSHWQAKGWLHPEDPRGWFQWYCRFYYGRRSDDDQRQITRHNQFKARHTGGLLKGCHNHPVPQLCRPRQRQGLLQWAADCEIIPA